MWVPSKLPVDSSLQNVYKVPPTVALSLAALEGGRDLEYCNVATTDGNVTAAKCPACVTPKQVQDQWTYPYQQWDEKCRQALSEVSESPGVGASFLCVVHTQQPARKSASSRNKIPGKQAVLFLVNHLSATFFLPCFLRITDCDGHHAALGRILGPDLATMGDCL